MHADLLLLRRYFELWVWHDLPDLVDLNATARVTTLSGADCYLLLRSLNMIVDEPEDLD